MKVWPLRDRARSELWTTVSSAVPHNWNPVGVEAGQEKNTRGEKVVRRLRKIRPSCGIGCQSGQWGEKINNKCDRIAGCRGWPNSLTPDRVCKRVWEEASWRPAVSNEFQYRWGNENSPDGRGGCKLIDVLSSRYVISPSGATLYINALDRFRLDGHAFSLILSPGHRSTAQIISYVLLTPRVHSREGSMEMRMMMKPPLCWPFNYRKHNNYKRDSSYHQNSDLTTQNTSICLASLSQKLVDRI